MSTEEPRIVVLLDRDRSPFSGRVQVAGEPERPFGSWLGLLSALQEAEAGLRGCEGQPAPEAGALSGAASQIEPWLEAATVNGRQCLGEPPSTPLLDAPGAMGMARTGNRVIGCECGFEARGETDEEIVEAIERHLAEEHPALAGGPTRGDLLALARERGDD